MNPQRAQFTEHQPMNIDMFTIKTHDSIGQNLTSMHSINSMLSGNQEEPSKQRNLKKNIVKTRANKKSTNVLLKTTGAPGNQFQTVSHMTQADLFALQQKKKSVSPTYLAFDGAGQYSSTSLPPKVNQSPKMNQPERSASFSKNIVRLNQMTPISQTLIGTFQDLQIQKLERAE